MTRRISLLVLAGAACALAGCSAINKFEDPAAVGDWTGASDARNQMTLEVDGDGDAMVFSGIPDNMGGQIPVTDRFRIEWEQSDESEFELVLTCRNSTLSCENNSPEYVCDINRKGDALKCKTSHPVWVNYPFNWNRDD